MEFKLLGKILISAGAALVAVGIVFWLSPKLPAWFGRLPGDIAIHRKNFSFYFPLATCLLLSIILSLILWIFGKR